MDVLEGLRMVVVTHYFAPHVGGTETVAGLQAQRAARHGAHVEVHTTRLPTGTPSHEDRTPRGARGTLHVVRHRAGDPLARTLQLPVPVPTPRMLRDVTAAARRADVVVAHGHAFPTSLLAAIAARRAARPFVLVQHAPWVAYGPVLDAVERLVDRTLGRAVIRAARRVVAVSAHTADHVRAIVPDADVRVVPNGVDTARFTPDGPRRTGTRPVVLFVGRLVRRNGWDVLLDAWRRAGLEDRAELHVAGTGPDRAALRAAATPVGGIHLLGHVPDEELPARYRGAALVVVPTVTGAGFGLVAAEAAACGTPVVASDHGGLREAVRDGVDGRLVPPGDPVALAATLRELVDDPAQLARLGRSAGRRDRSALRAADEALGQLVAGAGPVRTPARSGRAA